jgi:hypothetical protein
MPKKLTKKVKQKKATSHSRSKPGKKKSDHGKTSDDVSTQIRR